ncbi:MAG TPA: hypothetical protein VGL10_00425 [Gammaproteobacteria bacterium]
MAISKFMHETRALYNALTGWSSDITKPIVLEEVNALIRYASENGIDSPGPNPKQPEETTLVLLRRAAAEYEPYYDDQEMSPEKIDAEVKVLYHYSRLTKQTKIEDYPINGRTLIETSFASRSLFWLFGLTFIFLGLAVLNEVLTGWVDQTDPPFTQVQQDILFFQKHVMMHLIPYIWGGLGACMYLLMRLYNIATCRAFDRARLHGWALRVLLASVLAAVTLYVINPAALTEDGIPLEAKSFAFLIGLGVKIVYGAFEKLVDTLADKFNLNALRRQQDNTQTRDFIACALANPAFADDPKKREVLLELLKTANPSSKC